MDRYAHLPSLRGARADAARWRAAARAAGVERIEFLKNPKRGLLLRALGRLGEKIRRSESELGLLVFAGRAGERGLCAADYRGPDDALSEEVLRDALGPLPPESLVGVLDCSPFQGPPGSGLYRCAEPLPGEPPGPAFERRWLRDHVLFGAHMDRAALEREQQDGQPGGLLSAELLPRLFTFDKERLFQSTKAGQISPATNGFVEFEIKDGDAVLGRLVVTGDAPTESPLEPERAAWSWKGSPTDFPSRFELHRVQGTGNPAADAWIFRDGSFPQEADAVVHEDFRVHRIRRKDGPMIGHFWNRRNGSVREQFWTGRTEEVEVVKKKRLFRARSGPLVFEELDKAPPLDPERHITTL